METNISFKQEPDEEKEILDLLHPIVRKWFLNKFKKLALPQKYAVMDIHSRQNILVSAPTGSGKCITPDSTILLSLDNKTKIFTGEELIKLAKDRGEKITNFDKSGYLYNIPLLQSYSLINGTTLKKSNAWIYFEEYKGNVYRLKTEYGRDITVSPDHPLLVETENEQEWIPARNLKVGQKIGVPITINLPEKEIMLDYKKAISNLKNRGYIVIDYRIFEDLRKKTNNFKKFDKLSKDEIYKIKVLTQNSFLEMGRKLNIGMTTVFSIMNGKTKYMRKELFRFFKKECKKIKFEKNRLIVKNNGANIISFTHPEKVNVKLARWIAFVMAEGLIGEYLKGTHLAISQKNRLTLLKEFLKTTEEIFNLKFKKKTEKDYAIYSSAFCYFLTDLLNIKRGRGRNVPLPDWLLDSKKEIKSNFLNVFFSLEGDINGKEITVWQANKNKIETINYLLSSFGIIASLGKRLKFATNTEKKTKREYYHITIRQIRNLKIFVENIGIDHPGFKKIKKHILKKTSGEYIFKHKFDYKKIRYLSKFYENDKLFKKDMNEIYEVARRTGYITNNALLKLTNKIKKFSSDEKVKELRREAANLLNKNICWLKIKKITKMKYRGELVDLTVPNIHNFIGGFGGIYLHNTLTAFLAILNELVDSAEKGILQDKIYAVYISPLKALNNDIKINLLEPLQEIEELYGKKLNIRVGVRTGDTTQSEKSQMLKNPPHILITTPESLGIVLSSTKFIEHLKQVDWCIVDEIHALAENKRGVHLSISLERLQNLAGHMCRVGLSATVSPLDEIARFLVGPERGCKIVDVQFMKNIDLQVMSPVPDLINCPHTLMHKEMYTLLDKLIQEHKTTLIFTNTRSATERVVDYLKDKFPKKYLDNIGAHHGSLSKELRHSIETRMRDGKLKVIVSSTSLELGIDIGFIDLVICIGSPKSVARLLQRCLSYKSKILLSDGSYKAIGEIVDKKLNVKIISYDHSKGFIVNKIESYHKNKSKEIMKLKLHSGSEIECTYEHPLLTKQSWKKAEELAVGEEVAEIFDFDKDSAPYVYEMINQHEFYVENFNDFFKKSMDEHLNKKNLQQKKLVEKLGLNRPQIRDYRRSKGRRKSIRLDIFLKIMKSCNVTIEKYLPHLRFLKSRAHHREKLPLKLTPEIMWLAGIVATDGSITQHKTKKYYKIKIGNKDIKLLKQCQNIFKKFGFESNILKRKNKNFYHLDCGSKILANILLSLGLKTKNKSRTVEISNFLYRLPKNLIIPFVEGVLEGDGNINDGMRIFSASYKFVSGLHNLLNRCGIHNYFIKQKAKTSKLIKKINYHEIYCLNIFRNKHIKTFLKHCVLKGKKARKLKRKKFAHFQIEKDIEKHTHWTKITEIQKIKKKDYTYNLTLEKEPNNFFVESVLTHNCGRAGHKLEATAKGRIIVMNRDDLVECAVMLKSAVEKKIDKVHIPTNCLDVLSQQVFGMALEQVWDEKELFNLLKKSYCYQNLSWKDYQAILSYLAGEYVDLEERHIYAKIWRTEGKIGKRSKMGRVIYMTNIGTIPDESFITVKIGNQMIGKLDEAFLEKLRPGDVFILGGDTYQFKFSRGMVAQVTATANRPPTVPSWVSEMLPLSFDLAIEIGKFRRFMFEKYSLKKSKKEITAFINEYLYVDKNAANAIYSYFRQQFDFAKVIPNDKLILIEKYDDEREKKVVVHALFGRRVTDCLSRAIAFVISRKEHKNVEIGINDNGFYLSEGKVKEAIELLKIDKLDMVMEQAIEKSEVYKRRFRHCAARALMILRNYLGHKKNVGRQQVSSMILMSALRRIDEKFFLIQEARREVLEDLMDIENTKKVIKMIQDGEIKIKEITTTIPSPFSFNLALQGHLDVMSIEDKHDFLRRMHELVMGKIGLDPEEKDGFGKFKDMDSFSKESEFKGQIE